MTDLDELCTCGHPRVQHAGGFDATGTCLTCVGCLDPDRRHGHVADRCPCTAFTSPAGIR